MWVKSTQTTNYNSLFDCETGRLTLMWGTQSGDQLGYVDGSSYYNYGSNPADDGNWHHLAFVFDAEQSKTSAYIDGEVFGTVQTYNNHKNLAGTCAIGSNYLGNSWGFDGYIVSDCGAIADLNRPLGHKYTNRFYKSAAEAVKNGCDLNCGFTYRWLPIAYRKGLITEADINKSVKRLFLARFKLGMFDPPELCKYQQIPYSMNDCEAHAKLNLRAARESIVLLKNENKFLQFHSAHSGGIFRGILPRCSNEPRCVPFRCRSSNAPGRQLPSLLRSD